MMRAIAPGRVNLIGDHTDYTGGLVFPMAIDRYTTIDFKRMGTDTHLTSDAVEGTVSFAVGSEYSSNIAPSWGKYIGAVASLVENPQAITGNIATTIPVGAGLSSSAALEIAAALALGCTLPPTELAQLTRAAEHRATGVPTGIMDQLCIASAQAGHGTLIDCHSLEVQHIAIPTDVEFIVRFIAHRTLVGSEYADRVAQCTKAEEIIGPLRESKITDVDNIEDTTIRSRAHHVISENQRVREFTTALVAGDYRDAGQIMTSGHWSLAHSFSTSTPHLDSAVHELLETPGVLGARMTGGGFGGCVVAMVRAGTTIEGWRVKPVGAARVHTVSG